MKLPGWLAKRQKQLEKTDTRSRTVVEASRRLRDRDLQKETDEATEIPNVWYDPSKLSPTCPPAELIPGVLIRVVETNGKKVYVEPL